MPPPPYGLPEVSHFTWSHPRLPAAPALLILTILYVQLWAADNQPPTPPLSAFIIPQLISFVKYFIRLFWNYFYFFLRFQRAPCAAPRFPFTLQGRWLGFAVPIFALSKKEIPLLSFRPITPHIRDILFSLLRRFARFRICIIFGNLLYRFW